MRVMDAGVFDSLVPGDLRRCGWRRSSGKTVPATRPDRTSCGLAGTRSYYSLIRFRSTCHALECAGLYCSLEGSGLVLGAGIAWFRLFSASWRTVD